MAKSTKPVTTKPVTPSPVTPSPVAVAPPTDLFPSGGSGANTANAALIARLREWADSFNLPISGWWKLKTTKCSTVQLRAMVEKFYPVGSTLPNAVPTNADILSAVDAYATDHPESEMAIHFRSLSVEQRIAVIVARVNGKYKTRSISDHIAGFAKMANGSETLATL